MRKRTGFTFIELLITLSILGLVLGIGMPDFSRLQLRFQAKALTSAIRQVLTFARQYSIEHGDDITVCGIDSGGRCARDNFFRLAAFIDRNQNRVIDEDETVITLKQLKYRGNLALRASLNRSYIQFQRSGASKQAGSFTYCHPQYQEVTARITISMAGRTYIARDNDGDGIVELANGNAITCS